jgi:hypothetical protein
MPADHDCDWCVQKDKNQGMVVWHVLGGGPRATRSRALPAGVQWGCGSMMDGMSCMMHRRSSYNTIPNSTDKHEISFSSEAVLMLLV